MVQQNKQQQDDQAIPSFLQQQVDPGQVFVAGGSPEVPAVIEQSSNAPEQGAEAGEALKNNEQNISPDLKSIERKEGPQQQQQQIYQTQTPQLQSDQQATDAMQTNTTGVKFYGYSVSADIINNFQNILLQKGKGKTNSAKTWLYIFLDRLLKKQAEGK